MGKITKIQISNCYGIHGREILPSDVNVIKGENGEGKTSILDAIQTAFTNKAKRTDLVFRGENEASLYIETDNGLSVERVKKLKGSDKNVVIDDGRIVSSPESYLRSLFEETQVNPLAFLEMGAREQQKILLNLTTIEYTFEQIKEDFGEIPPDWKENLHMLENLDFIQGKKSEYWERREEAGRKELFKRRSIEEQEKELPFDFSAEKWDNYSLSTKYAELESINALNARVLKANQFLTVLPVSLKSIDDRAKADTFKVKEVLDAGAKELRDKISELQAQLMGLESKAEAEIEEINKKKVQSAEELASNADKAEKFTTDNKIVETEEMISDLKKAEEMKTFVKLSESIDTMRDEREQHESERKRYDDLIQVARKLPAKLLKLAVMPIDNMAIKDGDLLVNGLHLDSLSDGEKLMLALTVAKKQAGELGIILADGFEKLDSKRQAQFITEAKKSGLQYFITKVDDGELTIESY